MAKKAAKKTAGRPKKVVAPAEDFNFGIDEQENETTAEETKPVVAKPVDPKTKRDPRCIGNCPIIPGPFGDKDPQVVEWFKANEPEEFERRYGNRKTHLPK